MVSKEKYHRTDKLKFKKSNAWKIVLFVKNQWWQQGNYNVAIYTTSYASSNSFKAETEIVQCADLKSSCKEAKTEIRCLKNLIEIWEMKDNNS